MQPTADSTAIAIPARMESKRFPDKPLAMARGKPLIWWVWQAVSKTKLARHKFIITDSTKIMRWCDDNDVTCVFDKREFPTGSDRIAARDAWLDTYKIKIVVNLQCDEPELTAADLDFLIEQIQKHPSILVATYSCPWPTRLHDSYPDDVKVVVNRFGNAIYFSRQEIPGDIHVGVYAYCRRILDSFHRMPQSKVELSERLEQLRLLDAGIPIRVFKLGRHVTSINRKEDLEEWNQITTKENG